MINQKRQKKIELGFCQCGCGEKTNIIEKNDNKRLRTKGKLNNFINGHNARNGNLAESKNNNWKGDNVGYQAVHWWIKKKYGKPKKCEDCGITTLPQNKYHWANISGKYKRDIKDYKRLCYKCHRKFDSHLLPRGENNSNSKLTKKDVIKIRKLYKPYKFGCRKIAIKFKVSTPTIYCVIKKRIWKHI